MAENGWVSMAENHTGLLSTFLGRSELGDTSSYGLVVAIAFMVTLLCACIVIGHLLEETRWMNESITAIVLGLISGVIVLIATKGNDSHILEFNENLFFIYLLPPIIFNAGFQVKKKEFFRNFVAIVLFGVIGVFISYAIIAVGCGLIFSKFNLDNQLSIDDYMVLGVIFSATDTVCTLQVLHQDETPLLYSLVFGEGVVNDATSVVLFRTVQTITFSEVNALTVLKMLGNFLYLLTMSTILGVTVGLLSAFIIKKLYFGRHSTDREIAIMILMAYLSYMLAELFYLSGILTVFFCGIVMSHYTWHNVTESSRITTRHTFATLSFIAETFIFLYVGMDALDKDKWKMTNVSWATSVGLSATLVFLVLLGRAAFVFPLSALSNCIQKTPGTGISTRHQVVIWWAGLMRGAVSIALAYNQFSASGNAANPIHATMITSTIIVVLSSTVVFGTITKPLLGWLLPHHLRSISDLSDPPTPKDNAFPEFQIPLLGDGELPAGNGFPGRRSSLRMLLQAPTSFVHHFWRKFDDTYMRPVFGGRGFVPYIPGSPVDDAQEPQHPDL
eukprot:c23429_g1_i1 orf=170-1846(+)